MNTADEKTVQEARKKEKIGRDLELHDLRFLLSQVQFQRFILRLIGHCGVLETPFNLNSKVQDANIGRGDVGRFLFAEIDGADSKAFAKLFTEAIKNSVTGK